MAENDFELLRVVVVLKEVRCMNDVCTACWNICFNRGILKLLTK